VWHCIRQRLEGAKIQSQAKGNSTTKIFTCVVGNTLCRSARGGTNRRGRK